MKTYHDHTNLNETISTSNPLLQMVCLTVPLASVPRQRRCPPSSAAATSPCTSTTATPPSVLRGLSAVWMGQQEILAGWWRGRRRKRGMRSNITRNRKKKKKTEDQRYLWTISQFIHKHSKWLSDQPIHWNTLSTLIIAVSFLGKEDYWILGLRTIEFLGLLIPWLGPWGKKALGPWGRGLFWVAGFLGSLVFWGH